jgi:hypothetical protein
MISNADGRPVVGLYAPLQWLLDLALSELVGEVSD